MHELYEMGLTHRFKVIFPTVNFEAIWTFLEKNTDVEAGDHTYLLF